MNLLRSHILQRTISSLIIGTSLFLAGATDASAHKTDYRSYVVHRQYSSSHTRTFPGWLRRDREFQHWYLNTRYRAMPRLSWQRLYNIYCFDKRYRLQSHRFYGEAYRDYGYRSYQRKSKKRKH